MKINFTENIRNRNIVLAVLTVVVIAGGAWFFVKNKHVDQQEVSTFAPVDVVLDFYRPWLEALQSTSTDPYKEGLAKAPILSKELRKQISSAKKLSDGEVDPVLCQTAVPTKITSSPLYESEDKAEVLIVAVDEGFDGQAIVTLKKYNDGWYIDSIRCAAGEFAPQREFNFEREGYLLKDSVQPPLDPKYWYLVFEDNGELGHTAPLFFSEESICTSLSGDEGVCDPNQFLEGTKAAVYGGTNEYGVTVNKLKFVE